jgi:hypothetical protein
MAPENWAVMTTGWTSATMKRTRQPTKKERKTNQKQHGIDKNTETRGEKERQSLSLLPGKAAQGGRKSPTKEAAGKNPRFFQSFSL